MKRGAWRFAVGLLTGWLLVCGLTPAGAARKEQIDKDLSQKKKDLKQIKKELSQTKEREREMQGQESSVLSNLHRLETELDRNKRELKGKEARLDQTRERLDQTKRQISVLNQEMGQNEEELFSRLNALYRMGRIPPETLLLASQSYLDLLKIDKYLKVLIQSDARLLEKHRGQMTLKEKYREELVKDQGQWQRSIAEVQRKREEIDKGKDAKQTLLKSIRNQRVVYQKVIGELEDRAKGLQALIGKLEKEKSAVAYSRPRPEGTRAKVALPVQGKVISLFKEKGQNGIEIQAPMGAEIRSIFPGKVLYSDWFKGFGNVVIIDHGDRLFTVSGYASQLLKKAGENVSQGEAVALVGGEGSLKGPCLYFEIRHHGKPQDPLHWLSYPDKLVSLPNPREKSGDPK